MLAKIKTFFADLWAKIKADFVNAITLLATMVSGIIAHLDSIAAELGAPHLIEQLGAIGADAKMIAKYVFGVSILGMIARFNKLVQSPPPPPPAPPAAV